MEQVLVGSIVNTFGIKGELKIFSDFELAEKVFKVGHIVIINNEKHQITKARTHKKHYLIEIDNIDNINLVLCYKGLQVFTERKTLALKDHEYLLKELVNFELYDKEFIGKVTEVFPDKRNPLIKINNEFYIPVYSDYIIKIDVNNKKIIGENIKELKL